MNGTRVCAVTAAAAIALFAAGALFAHPAADDFVYAANGGGGIWQAWLREYLAWNGRYTSNAILLAVPLKFGIAAYRMALVVMIASTAAAMFVFVRTWGSGLLSGRDAATWALAFTALFYSRVPSIGDAAYWYTGAATYQLWAVAMLLHLTLVGWCMRRQRSGFAAALAGVLIVGVAGFNEISMLFAVALYAGWMTWARWNGDRISRLAIVLFAVAVAAGLAVLFAPGNAVRQSMYVGMHHQPGRSVAMTTLQTLRFVSAWLTDGAALLGVAVFVPTVDRWAAATRADPVRARRGAIVLAAGMLMTVPIATFPAYWETGVLGQHRTINVAYFAFLLLGFAAAACVLAAGGSRADRLRTFCVSWHAPLAILFAIAILFSGNAYTVGSDLLAGRFTAFDRDMRSRYDAISACRAASEPVCRIDAARSVPASYVFPDVSRDATDFVNAAYTRYFGVRVVKR